MIDTRARDMSLHSMWAQAMADDIRLAKDQVHLSALSLHFPSKMKNGPHSALLMALQAASTNRAQVNVYLPAPNLHHPATLYNRSSAARLHAQGVRVHLLPMPCLLHAKACAIDGAITWVGSGNITAAAAHHNLELYLRVCDTEITKELVRCLTAWGRGCRVMEDVPA